MVANNFRLLRWFSFFYSFRPYVAITILYFSQVSGSYTLGFAVLSVVTIASSLLEIPTGIFSDRVGRRKTVVIASMVSLLALGTYALANSFVILAIGSIFNGLGQALISGNNNALLHDSLKEENHEDDFPEKLGKVYAVAEVGFAVSTLLGGFIALLSLRAVMMASILPQFVCIIIALRLVESKTHTKTISENIFSHLKEALQAFRTNFKLRQLSIAYIIDSTVEMIDYELKPAFNALIWPTWALGITRALDHISGFFGSQYAGKVIKKFGAIHSLLTLDVIVIINRAIFIGYPNILSPVMLSLNSFKALLSETANQTLLHSEFTDKHRATMGSLNSLGISLLFSLLIPLVGILADQIGPRMTFLLLPVFSVIVLPIYWNSKKYYNKHDL